MPRPAGWLLSVADAGAQLESFERDLLTRRDLEELLGIGRSRACELMRKFGAVKTGNVLTVRRCDLVQRLDAVLQGGSFSREIGRRDRFVGYPRKARPASVRVPVVPHDGPRRMTGLPDGVVVEPGRIEVRFGEPSEALTALLALAQALIADYDGFEALVRR